VPETSTPTYYERPALKAAEWRWLIVTYLFVGGLAGAAQVIGEMVDVAGSRRDQQLVSAARYLAFVGALASACLLIADLKTPSRWFNMLRIYRSTSPMSIGSWTLFVFGGSSTLAALAQAAADLVGAAWARRWARLLGAPAALSGAIIASYTGALLSATSTPLWASAYRLLPPLFGISGAATATAALSLILDRVDAPRGSRQRLDRLAMLTSAAELLLTLQLERLWKRAGLDTPLRRAPLAAPYRFGVLGLGILAPLGVHLLQVISGRELERLSRYVSVAALVGGYTQRAVVLFAGKRSAERPDDYFRYAAR
jgi:formate-dependent nitrite reductase membrane component NrfD